MQIKRLAVILLVALFILLIPFVAMQFTEEVNWTVFDFLVAAVLLISSGLLCEFVLRTVKQKRHRLAICIGILVLLILVWVELAVGILETPFAGS